MDKELERCCADATGLTLEQVRAMSTADRARVLDTREDDRRSTAKNIYKAILILEAYREAQKGPRGTVTAFLKSNPYGVAKTLPGVMNYIRVAEALESTDFTIHGETAALMLWTDLMEEARRWDVARKHSTKEEGEGPSDEEVGPFVGRPADVAYFTNDKGMVLKEILGNACLTAVMEALMEDDRVQALITDPPFGVKHEGSTWDRIHNRSRKQIANDGLSDRQHLRFLKTLLGTAAAYLDGPALIFSGDTRLPETQLALRALGFRFGRLLTWDKGEYSGALAGEYWCQDEKIVYAWPEGKPHPWHGGNDHSDIIRDVPKLRKHREHPHRKPQALIERFIRYHTERHDTILDVCAGSGTALFAAYATGRGARLVEIEPKYFDWTCREWRRRTGFEVRIGSEDGPTFEEVEAQRLGPESNREP